MVPKKKEYASLREELISHQERRINILNVSLTASSGLLAINAQLESPYLPMFVLLILFSALVLIAQTEYGIQRIASYIRVVLERDNPDLNWETASFWIRKESTKPKIWDTSPILPPVLLLSAVSLAAVTMSLWLSWSDPADQTVSIVVASVWGLAWLLYLASSIRRLMFWEVDKNEASQWGDFMKEPGPKGNSPSDHEANEQATS